MTGKSASLFAVVTLLFVQGCVKRLPAVSGGDKKVVAGHEMTFGSAEKVPDGGSVVWTMGDGSRYKGAKVRHAWHRPGKFQVVVTVTDPDGKKRKDTSTVEVYRPALLDVIPASAGFVLLVDKPGEKFKNVPLLMEHLFSSGAEVNSTLAKIREMLGFDPFSSDGWRQAGIDSTSGIALAGLDGGSDLVLVAGLLPGDAARQTLRHLFLTEKNMVESPAENAPYVTAVTQGESKDVRFAYMNFRGHLWIAFPGDNDKPNPKGLHKGPVQVLAQLRAGGLQAGLDDNKEWFAPALASNRGSGAIQLLMSREFVKLANEKDFSNSKEKAEEDAIIKKMQFIRMDLNLLPEAIKTNILIGFEGKEASRLAALMRARNAVPAFRSTMAGGNHFALKWSLDLMGLVEAAADISGEKDEWIGGLSAIKQFKASTGIDVKDDILDNLGYSVIVAAKLKMSGLLGLAVGGSGEKPHALDAYLDATALVELKDSKRFFSALDALSHVESMGSFIRAIKTSGYRQWSVGPKELGLVLAQADGMAVLATSHNALESAIVRLGKPHKPDIRWPESMDKPEYQLMACDLMQLRHDFEVFEPSAQNASGAMLKNMLMMTIAGFGKLDMLVIDSLFRDKVLVISGSLSMK